MLPAPAATGLPRPALGACGESRGNMQYIGIYGQDYGVFLAGTLLSILPPEIISFALQREFVSGLTRGAVTGRGLPPSWIPGPPS